MVAIILLNIIFIIFLSVSIFVLSTRFSYHSIMALLAAYVLFSIILLYMKLELIAIFLILIYAGGVMILFMFFLFISDSSVSVNSHRTIKSLPKFPAFIFICFSALLVLITTTLWVIKMQFITTSTLNMFVLLISTNNIHLELTRWILFMLINNNAPVIGLTSTSLISVGSYMYLAFYIHSLVSFSILLSVLLSITTILSDSDIFKSITKKSFFKDYTQNSLFFLIQIAYSFSPFGFTVSLIMGFCIFSIFFLLLVFILNSAASVNLLRYMIFMELMLLPILGLLLTASIIWSNIDGLILSMFLLSIFASESALGLSILTLQQTSKIFFK